MFYFNSWAEFMAMDGHGGYVWVCYAITWAVLVYLLVSPWWRQRRWMRRQRVIQKRQAVSQKGMAQTAQKQTGM